MTGPTAAAAPRPNGADGPARPAHQRYEIRDPSGALLAIHERIDAADGSKRFLWRSPDGALGLGERAASELPLYGIERLDGFASRVLVTEGEKAAQALLDRGVPAVGTVTGASGCPGARALGELAGRHIVLWPDADEPGRRHMDALAVRLAGIAASVAIIEPPAGVRSGWDAADAVAEGRDLAALVAAARPFEPSTRRPSRDLETGGQPPETLVITRLADVAAQPVEWLWPGYLPSGMLCLLDGDPGVGKSTLTDDLAARASTGRPMPDGSGGGEPAGVVILSAEDDLARTVRPRLEAAGADLARIATVALRERDGGMRAPLITREDLAAVELAVKDTDARFLIVDPLMAYLPDETNTNRDHDVRRALRGLAELAERTGCAVLAVRHLRKGAAENPLYRGGGSIGIIAAARAAFLLARDPEDAERRVLAPLKMNVAPEPPARAFRLELGPGHAHPHVSWEGVSPLDASALLAVPDGTEDRSALQEAKEVLRQILADGPERADVARLLARRAGVSDRTLARARQSLAIVPRHVGRPGESDQHWEWCLPPKAANGARRLPSSALGTLGTGLAAFDDPDAADPTAIEADCPRSALALEADDE